MAVEVAASTMLPLAPPKPKTGSESLTEITAKSNTMVTVEKTPDSTAPRFPGYLGALRITRTFAPIPPFSGPRDIKGKPDLRTPERNNVLPRGLVTSTQVSLGGASK
jgi:hypothetical protein